MHKAEGGNAAPNNPVCNILPHFLLTFFLFFYHALGRANRLAKWTHVKLIVTLEIGWCLFEIKKAASAKVTATLWRCGASCRGWTHLEDNTNHYL